MLFPNSNLRTAKLRPAVIIPADNLQTMLPQILVAMVTSRLDRAGHPSRVAVSVRDAAGKTSGLLKDSVIMTDNLATVFLTEVDRRIGHIPMVAVDQALRHTLLL